MILENEIDWSKRPEAKDWKCRGQLMTNFDHTVNQEFAEKMKADPNLIGEYSARNFHGLVRYDPPTCQFIARITIYGAVQAYIGGATPEDIMIECSEAWGDE